MCLLFLQTVVGKYKHHNICMNLTEFIHDYVHDTEETGLIVHLKEIIVPRVSSQHMMIYYKALTGLANKYNNITKNRYKSIFTNQHRPKTNDPRICEGTEEEEHHYCI